MAASFDQRAASSDILSWTNQDSRESVLFNARGILYKFQTTILPNGSTVTIMLRTLRPGKEDRVAKLEWSADGGLGRVIIAHSVIRMIDLARPVAEIYSARTFVGPDGLYYRWRPSTPSGDVILQDPNGDTIAFFRPTRQTHYQMGDVYGELHFIRSAGLGTVMHPPMMDMVALTAMLYRFCDAWNI